MRPVNQEFLDALKEREIRPIILFKGAFESGDVRVWTGLGSLTYNNEEYTGLGTLVGVEAPEETAQVRATGWSVSLSGVSPESVSLAIDESPQGAKGELFFGLLDDDGDILDVTRIGLGKLDVPTIEDSADTARINITYESDLIDLERPRETRYTNESQQARFPGDKGFEHVADLQQKEVAWGRESP